MLIPVGVVHATITGTPSLGAISSPAGTIFQPATKNASVIAGTENVTLIDGVAPTWTRFAVNFDGVTFSGATFYLYISKNGLANVNTTAGDIRYAGPFSVTDLTSGTYVPYPSAGIGGGITGASYMVGMPSGHDVVVGPIPVQISSAYKYIKAYDGSCGANPTFCGGTGVAGATQKVLPQPGITISKTSGPAGTAVAISGGGFPSNMNVAINATYHSWNWAGAMSTKKVTWIASIPTTGSGHDGWFGPSFGANANYPMVDTNQVINVIGGPRTAEDLLLFAVNASSLGSTINSAQKALNTPTFEESNRGLGEVESFGNTGVVVPAGGGGMAGNANPFSTGRLFGNGTGGSVGVSNGTTVATLSQPINAYVFGFLQISGNFSDVGVAVTFWVGATQLSTPGPVIPDSSGNWNTTVSIPVLSKGVHTVTVKNDANYQFTINVLPTIYLQPTHGQVGTTVNVIVYGFPGNARTWVYWDEMSWGDGHAYLLTSGLVSSTGSFNSTVTFTVPNSYGLVPHLIYGISNATFDFPGASPLNSTIAALPPSGVTTFTVDPKFWVTPTSTADNGQLITGWGNGLAPGCTKDGDENFLGLDCDAMQDLLAKYGISGVSQLYSTVLDNFGLVTSATNVGSAYGAVEANGTGGLSIAFPAAGLRPGMHVLELNGGLGGHAFLEIGGRYDNQGASGTYAPTLWAFFNITTTGDPIADQLTSINTAVSGLTTSLTAIQTSLTNIQTSLTAVQASVSSISSSLSGISSAVTAIQSSLTGVTGSLSSIQASLTTITGDVSGLGSQLTSLQASASSIQQSASSLTTSVGNLGTQLTSIQNSLSSMAGTLTSIGTDAHTAATQATAAAGSAANAVTGNSTAQTYVLVVAVLAAITLVLELAILVRKLS